MIVAIEADAIGDDAETGGIEAEPMLHAIGEVTAG